MFWIAAIICATSVSFRRFTGVGVSVVPSLISLTSSSTTVSSNSVSASVGVERSENESEIFLL